MKQKSSIWTSREDVWLNLVVRRNYLYYYVSWFSSIYGKWCIKKTASVLIEQPHILWLLFDHAADMWAKGILIFAKCKPIWMWNELWCMTLLFTCAAFILFKPRVWHSVCHCSPAINASFVKLRMYNCFETVSRNEFCFYLLWFCVVYIYPA